MAYSLQTMDWFLQRDWIEKIVPQIGETPWTSVYESKVTETENLGIFSALIHNSFVEQVLRNPEWDLSSGDGGPGCIVSYGEDGVKHISYHRYGDDSGVEPLVLNRYFHGARQDYNEIVEEFRLFHSLYHDTEKGQMLRFDEGGDATVVARIEPDLVEIRTKEIRQFLAIKNMHLAVFFDIKRFSDLDVGKLSTRSVPLDICDNLSRYTLYADSSKLFRERSSWSRLLGKKLIPGFALEKSGAWPYKKEERKFVDFIVGIDKDGDEILAPSNASSSPYLTPIFFRREVLTKYFANPDRYSVEDGYLRCQGLWGVQIDNNHDEYVIVFLGDLGRDVPHKEQLYWRSYNVAAAREKISETNYRRSFLAEFTGPEKIDLIFKARFNDLNRDWREKFCWYLFLPLGDGDQHLYIALHVPLTEDQAEFDAQILALTKILIDSLNEQAIGTINAPASEIKGSISKVEEFLRSNNFDYKSHIRFLRNLQALRSTGVGHRKGSSYEKVAESLGLTASTRQLVFQKLLEQADDFLTALRRHFLI